MSNSLIKNLKDLEENKQELIDYINEKLNIAGLENSNLNLNSSWEEFQNLIQNLNLHEPLDDEVDQALSMYLSDSFTGKIILNTDVKEYSFYNRTSLKEVELTKENTTLGSYSFYNCPNLEKVNFENISSIGSYSFAECYGLKDSILLNASTINNRAFYFNINNTKMNISEFILTENVKTVGEYAFYSTINDYEILCEHPSKPSNFNSRWAYNAKKIYWNCKLKPYFFEFNNGDPSIHVTTRLLRELPEIEFSKEGYYFDDWYIDSDFSEKVILPYSSSKEIPVLYARWLKNIHFIVVDIEHDNLEIDLGIIPVNNFSDLTNSKIGYTINGFYLDSLLENKITDVMELDSQLIEPTIYIKGTELIIYEFEYTGTEQQAILPAGIYKLECWGAQGVTSTNNISSTRTYDKGGYSSGILTLEEPLQLYVYVGGRPYYDALGDKPQSTIYGGWNGGGGKYSGSSHNDNGPGAGATDMCLIRSDMIFESNSYRRSQESYLSRLIVAGGAGGGRNDYEDCVGGYAPSHSINGYNKAAGMTSGAHFGYGNVGSSQSDDRSGGGAGWYGGQGNDDSHGGGGSSFVWSIEHSQYIPSNYSVNIKYQLKDIKCLSGKEEQLSPLNVIEKGHSGNGYARISKISNLEIN